MPVGIGIGVSGIVGAGANLLGSSQQANAANNAANLQQQQYQQTRSDLLPYNQAGQAATNALTQQLPGLTAPINVDQATLNGTPGYQFALNQGLKSVQNGSAARGLGSSGAAMKGAASYATGLADNTYQNQFNDILQSRQNTYNMLSGQQSTGENAAAQTGNIGSGLAQGAANSLTQAGTAQAAGLTGAANSLTNAGNSYLGYNAFLNNNNGLNSGGLYSGTGTGGGG